MLDNSARRTWKGEGVLEKPAVPVVPFQSSGREASSHSSRLEERVVPIPVQEDVCHSSLEDGLAEALALAKQ